MTLVTVLDTYFISCIAGTIEFGWVMMSCIESLFGLQTRKDVDAECRYDMRPVVERFRRWQ